MKFQISSKLRITGLLGGQYAGIVGRQHGALPFYVSLDKLSNKQSSCWWFEIPGRSCNASVILKNRFSLSEIGAAPTRHTIGSEK